jgi:prophage regulatory protein
VSDKEQLIGSNPGGMRTFVRLPAVMAATGLARPTIYKKIKAGTFPAPIRISANAVAWDTGKIAEWQAKCISEAEKN